MLICWTEVSLPMLVAVSVAYHDIVISFNTFSIFCDVTRWIFFVSRKASKFNILGMKLKVCCYSVRDVVIVVEHVLWARHDRTSSSWRCDLCTFVRKVWLNLCLVAFAGHRPLVAIQLSSVLPPPSCVTYSSNLMSLLFSWPFPAVLWLECSVFWCHIFLNQSSMGCKSVIVRNCLLA